jgi:chromosome segregation ATPase
MNKDILVAEKDLSSILKKVKEQNEIFVSEAKKIEDLREEYKKISKLKQPLIDGLQKKISELQKTKGLFEGEIISLERKIAEQNEVLAKAVKEASNYKLGLDVEVEVTKDRIKDSEKELKIVINRIKDESEFLAKLKKETVTKAGVEKDVTVLIERRAVLLLEITEFEKEKEKILEIFRQLNEYRDSLDKRDKELSRDYGQVLLMKNRIKPKYIKIFKQYSNI